MMGRTLIAWTDFFTASMRHLTNYTNSVVLTMNTGFTFFLANIYGLTEDQQKIQLLDELRQLWVVNDLPWLIVDDFNLLRSLHETTGGNFNLGLSTASNNCIEDLSLIEIPINGRA